MKSRLFLLLLTVISTGSYAISEGDSSGGGGGLATFSNNPWFIQNTKEVTYCIAHNPNTFTAPRSLIKTQVLKAIQFHKNVFENWEKFSTLVKQPLSHFKLGTQNFTYSESCEDVDLEFRFGTLKGKHLKFIDYPERWVGKAVLTNYDRKLLKGKGFIYIGANTGDLAMYSPSEPIHKSPWDKCNGLFLYYTLIHELGHVFGLSHDSGVGFMNASFPRSAVGKIHVDILEKHSSDGACETEEKHYVDHTFYERKFFNTELRIFNNENYMDSFPVQTKFDPKNLSLTLEGKSGRFHIKSSLSHLGKKMNLVLPKEQQVIKTKEFKVREYPYLGGMRWNGNFLYKGEKMEIRGYGQSLYGAYLNKLFSFSVSEK